MNRKEKRKIKKEIEMFSNVVTIIKQYFPFLIEKQRWKIENEGCPC